MKKDQALLHLLTPTRTLVQWSDMPEWYHSLVKNQYIKTGYRVITPSVYTSMTTLFYMHNELINIWTHLLSCFYFLFLVYDISHKPLDVGDSYGMAMALLDRGMVLLQPLVCILCLLSSSLFHLFLSHSCKLATKCHCMDHSFIAVAVGGSCIATGYFTFSGRISCCYFIVVVMCTGLTISLNFGFNLIKWLSLNGGYESTHKNCDHSQTHSTLILKTASYIMLAALILVPYLSSDTVFPEVYKSAIVFLIGIVLFVTRFPERYVCRDFWGKYGDFVDMIGHSHQLWHLCVTAGMYYHHLSLLLMYKSIQ
jgi:adiponectin receptor